jgi:hypothetical protein
VQPVPARVGALGIELERLGMQPARDGVRAGRRAGALARQEALRRPDSIVGIADPGRHAGFHEGLGSGVDLAFEQFLEDLLELPLDPALHRV